MWIKATQLKKIFLFQFANIKKNFWEELGEMNYSYTGNGNINLCNLSE